MRFSTSLAFGALATLASAQISQIVIYSEAQYTGEQVSFAPDSSCHTISPSIRSISITEDEDIPEDEGIWCQLFDNAECTGEGGDVIVESVSEFEASYTWLGVICAVSF
ncbi:hypothetical protein BJX99DRAFT_263521 [Aspergillus californicus]